MAATPVSDTASILSHTSYASSSSSLSSTSSSSSRSSGATRSSGRGGAGNIKYSSTECLSIAEDPEPDDAVSVAPGREAPAAKQTSAHTTGRNGAGNIASSTIVHKASRVTSPDQHALTAALVSAQTEVVTRYERMLVKASLDEARNGRRSYGRGGAGNSASPAKSKASNSPKVVKRSRSLLLNYGSFRGSRSSSVDATIPEESEDLQTTINVSRKKMRKALSRSFLSLRTSHPTSTTALAAPTTAPSSPPTSAMSELSSPSSSASTLSSPELSVSTPSTSAPSSPLSGKIVEGPVGDSSVEVSVREFTDGSAEAMFFPPDEDGLACQLLERLHLRASWKPNSKRETMPVLRDDDATSISCADLDWMEAEWAEQASESDGEGEGEDNAEYSLEGVAEEDDFVDMNASKLNLNAVMRALLAEAQEALEA